MGDRWVSGGHGRTRLPQVLNPPAHRRRRFLKLMSLDGAVRAPVEAPEPGPCPACVFAPAFYFVTQLGVFPCPSPIPSASG